MVVLGENYRHLGDMKATTAAYQRHLSYVPICDGADKARSYIKRLAK